MNKLRGDNRQKLTQPPTAVGSSPRPGSACVYDGMQRADPRLLWKLMNSLGTLSTGATNLDDQLATGLQCVNGRR